MSYFGKMFFIEQKNNEIEQKNNEIVRLSQRDEELSRYKEELSMKDTEIEEKNNEIVRLLILLSQRDEEISRYEEEFSRKENELEQKNNENVRLLHLLSQRDEDLSLSKCEIVKLKRDIDDLNVEIQFNLQKKLEIDRQDKNNKMLEILRKEQKELEEKKELEELYKPLRKSMISQLDYYQSEFIRIKNKRGYLYINMLKTHNSRNEVILSLITFDMIEEIRYVVFSLTNTGLYCYRSKNMNEYDIEAEIYNCPVYIFKEQLSLQFAKLLINARLYPNSVHPTSVNHTVSKPNNYRDIESIIRIIPGEYKNGNWRQLDGFFGMYYNDVTGELSHLPPPFEE
jgi:hypothetical protein